jgi:hypothetical protein
MYETQLITRKAKEIIISTEKSSGREGVSWNLKGHATKPNTN